MELHASGEYYPEAGLNIEEKQGAEKIKDRYIDGKDKISRGDPADFCLVMYGVPYLA